VRGPIIVFHTFIPMCALVCLVLCSTAQRCVCAVVATGTATCWLSPSVAVCALVVATPPRYVARLAVHVYSRVHGPQQVFTARAQCNLARILTARGKFEEAWGLVQQARDVTQARYKRLAHIEVGHVLHFTALHHMERGQHALAVDTFRSAVHTYEHSYTHSQVPPSRNLFLHLAHRGLTSALNPGLHVAARLGVSSIDELAQTPDTKEGPFPGQDANLQLHLPPSSRTTCVSLFSCCGGGVLRRI